ncbi:MAG: hypothetical protein DI546_20470 [Rhizobium sp.]|nr:MAG: hypothetical protein DI546_20470 [Rhizobium sp.]
MQYKERYKLKKISKELANLCRNEKSGTYLFRKAIPERYRELAGKREFKISLKTNDFMIALDRFKAAKSFVDAMMLDLKRGECIKKSIRFEEASSLAKAQGRTLRPLDELLGDPSEFLEVYAQWKTLPQSTPEVFKSYFNASVDDIKISELVECYEREQTHVLGAANSRARKKKLTPLVLACKDLTQHLGQDKWLASLTDGDAKSFETELKSRIALNQIVPNTANKRLVALRQLIKCYRKSMGVRGKQIETPFDGMKFPENTNKRAAFTVKYVREKWLASNALVGLNSDARYLLLAMLDTGCGFKELCGLDPVKDIKLDADVPHIIIRPNANRGLKTKFRERIIPLVGFAFIAFQNCPNGFTRYAGPSGYESASAAINKFLKKNDLDEHGQCRASGLRHMFKDRLRDHQIPPELQDRLMGHQTQGMSPRYGNGYSLSTLQAALKQVESDFR